MSELSKYQPVESGNPAYSMACHSQLAYSGHRYVADKLKVHGFDRVYLFTYQGSNTYLAGYPMNKGAHGWILAFRGTENDYKDILHDITLFKRTADYDHSYRVHGGFLTALQHVWGSRGRQLPAKPDDIYRRIGPEGISEILIREVHPKDSLWITGHSLGGALAQLAAYYVPRDLNLPITGLYTFGAPRLLDPQMALNLKKQKFFPVYRYVHAADIVPRVPPWFLGFRHGAQEIYISKKGKIFQKPGILFKFFDIWYRQFLLIFLVAAVVFITSTYANWFDYWVWNSMIALTAGLLSWLMLPRLFKLIPFPILRGLRFRAFTDHGIQKYVNATKG